MFHPSKHQEAAASLATQAKILQAVLAMHKLNFIARETHCLEAVRCSRFSGDSGLQAAALMYLAYTYTYCLPRRPEKAISLYLQALHALSNETSLLRSDIYMGLADAYAQCKEEKKALEAIAFAQSAGLQSVAERSTSETIIHHADAARGLGDLDHYVACLEEGGRLALSLGSQKRYSEAFDIFQRTPEQWRHEQKIQTLAKDIFQQVSRRTTNS